MATFPLKQAAPQSGGGFTGERKTFDPIPEDSIVTAEVKEVTLEEKPARWRNGPDDTHRVSFHFVVTEGQYARRHLWGNSSVYFSTSPNCKLRLWAQEILGLDVWPQGEELDTDKLAGRQVRLIVGNRSKQDGSITDYVKDVLRAR